MGVATTFGVASTGTAISSLSGAAATNAALAWLGGGALAAGGGGIPAGTALLALAGPIGWTIAGLSILTSIIFFWMAKSEKDRLEDLFLLIINRDTTKYQLAIVEINERISRIKDETMKLNTAIEDIALFGTDYDSMTEEQQYTLGSYKNLMEASTQLLVNPIKGLQPQFTIKKLNSILKKNQYLAAQEHCKKHKDLIVYIANLLYSIDTDESDRKLLSKSFRNNEEFRKKMNLEKSDLDLELFNIANEVLCV